MTCACSAGAAAVGRSATSIATRGFRAGPLIVVDIPVTGPNDRRLAACGLERGSAVATFRRPTVPASFKQARLSKAAQTEYCDEGSDGSDRLHRATSPSLGTSHWAVRLPLWSCVRQWLATTFGRPPHEWVVPCQWAATATTKLVPRQVRTYQLSRNAACPWQVTIPFRSNVPKAEVMGDHDPQSAGFFDLLEILNLHICQRFTPFSVSVVVSITVG